jgi:hypothetical protein
MNLLTWSLSLIKASTHLSETFFQRVYQNVALLALDLLARILGLAMRIDAAFPFGALHTLAVDDGGGRARLAFGLLAAGNEERVMDAIERAVATPQDQIVVHRAPCFSAAGLWAAPATDSPCSRHT